MLEVLKSCSSEKDLEQVSFLYSLATVIPCHYSTKNKYTAILQLNLTEMAVYLFQIPLGQGCKP